MHTLSTLQRRALGGLAALSLAFGLVVIAGAPASSQTGPTDTCVDTVLTMQAGFGDRGRTLYSDSNLGTAMRRFGLDTPVPAGTYLVNAVSYDGYNERIDTAGQPNEQWVAELLDSEGNVVATTGSTADLPDGVLEATWSGSLGSVSWTGPDVVEIRVVHAVAGDATSPNSIEPVCVGLTPSDPVAAAAATTTTTEASEVLPEVTTRKAQAQTAQPDMTG